MLAEIERPPIRSVEASPTPMELPKIHIGQSFSKIQVAGF
jgi:hypothetical protein